MKFQQEELLISHEYPHKLMLHICNIMREKKINSPDVLLENTFLKEFQEKYAEYPHEIQELQVALRDHIIQEFLDNRKSPDWKKRAFITITLYQLIPEMKEWQAVELLESMMHLFEWELSFKVTRKWEVKEEDKANFHSFQKPSEVDDRTFEKQAIEHIQKSQDRKQNEKKMLLGNEQVKSFSDEIKIGKETDSRKKKKTNSPQKALREQKRKQDAVPKKQIVSEKDKILDIPIEELSDEECRQQLEQMEIVYEKLMSASVRRDLKRAKKGNALAQCSMGDFYAEDGTKHTNYEIAVKWYRFSARQGNLRAKMEIGKIFDSEKIKDNNAKQYGIRYFRELAEEGYPTAQYIIGMKYYLGDGMKKDSAKGVLWLKKAGYQGCIEAQRQLGDIYMNFDEKEAVKWYQMAKSNGDDLAERKLRGISRK